jgi:hypothetical protein
LGDKEGFVCAVLDAVERIVLALGLEEHKHCGRLQLAFHAKHYGLAILAAIKKHDVSVSLSAAGSGGHSGVNAPLAGVLKLDRQLADIEREAARPSVVGVDQAHAYLST